MLHERYRTVNGISLRVVESGPADGRIEIITNTIPWVHHEECARVNAAIIDVTAHPDDQPVGTSLSSIGSMIQWFKTGTTYDYISGVKHQGWHPFNKRLWQRNYWEHIVRNDREYERITAYIKANPSLWTQERARGTRKGDPVGPPFCVQRLRMGKI